MSDTVYQKPSLLSRLFQTLPFVGGLIKDAGKSDEALIFALLNVVMLWVFAGIFWGLEGVLAVALALVPVVLITLCAAMLFSGKTR
ncbi:hypothetical protein [Kordiimonas sp.]|uniref:hypothetical protein n=1 Tax=Kordiimonas sp. TaxID=1970157 RepID=UPI003A8F6A87